MGLRKDYPKALLHCFRRSVGLKDIAKGGKQAFSQRSDVVLWKHRQKLLEPYFHRTTLTRKIRSVEVTELVPKNSEPGRIRFQRARFQTLSSVSFFGPHQFPGRELSKLLSAFYLCAKANSPSFSENSPSLPQNSVRLSEFSSPKQYSRNSIPPVS